MSTDGREQNRRKARLSRALPLGIAAVLGVLVLALAAYTGGFIVQIAPQRPEAIAQEQAPTQTEEPAQPEQQAPEPAAPEPAAPEPVAPEQAPAVQEALVEEGLNISLDMTLRSARVIRVDLDDDEEELVEFTFDEDVQEIVEEDGFMLFGPDPKDLVKSDSAVLVKGDDKSVLVGFKAGTDIRSFTMAGVATGTVLNRNRETNVQDSVDLRGSVVAGRRGPTAGPDLLWVQLNSSREWIHFVFDENLDENARPNPGDFGFYTPSGRIRSGSKLISIEDNVVTIEFRKGAQVQEAVRYFVRDGAVKDLQGKANPMRAIGRGTSHPDLISARQVADTIYDFTFDEDVSMADLAKFILYTANGTKYVAKGATRLDSDTVRAFFPAINYFGDQMVLAVVDEGAVIANDGSGDRNTIGSRTMVTARIARTTGPDLIDVDFDKRSGLVTFRFDENIKTGIRIEDLKARDFLLLTSTGDLVSGITVVDYEGDRVIVHFPTGDVEDAEGATVNAGAVTDDEGNPNPLGTVLRKGASVGK